MGDNKTIEVVWQLSRGWWDAQIFEDLFSHRLWMPVNAHCFVHRSSIAEVEGDGAIIMFPGQHCVQSFPPDSMSRVLAPFKWVLFINYGDEESLYPTRLLNHPNMKYWEQMPIPGVHDFADRRIPIGYPPPAVEQEIVNDGRIYDWSFCGQITHVRRHQCAAGYRQIPRGYTVETDGFAKGLSPKEYHTILAWSKIVPCPSGNGTPDSFRLWEALEAGCVPIADGLNHRPHYPKGYWQAAIGEEPPFPIIEDWSTLPTVISSELDKWPHNANRIGAWYLGWKRRLAYALEADLNELTR